MTGIKRIILALLLCPVLSFGQLVEFSLKGGTVVNRLLQDDMSSVVKNPLGYSGSFAATVSFPGAVRLGFAVSAYDLKADVTSQRFDNNGKLLGNYTSRISFGAPLIPIEALLIKRFNPGRMRIDIGGSIGTCLNKEMSVVYDDAAFPDTKFTDKTNRWTTYGAIVGLQYRLSCRSGIGFEVQPKWLKVVNYSPAFIMPVMAKYCFYII